MQQEGDAEGAKKQFETSLKMFQDVHGEDAAKKHPHIAILKHNLGRAYQSSGDLTAARENLESSLDISKKVYGDEAKHPGIGHTLLGLEELDRKEGRISEAEYRKKAAKKILDVMFKERRGTYLASSATTSTQGGAKKPQTKTQMRWNVLRKSVKNQNKALKSSARNLLVLAMDKGTEDEDAEQGGGTNGTQVVVEMKPLGRIDSEEAVLDL